MFKYLTALLIAIVSISASAVSSEYENALGISCEFKFCELNIKGTNTVVYSGNIEIIDKDDYPLIDDKYCNLSINKQMSNSQKHLCYIDENTIIGLRASVLGKNGTKPAMYVGSPMVFNNTGKTPTQTHRYPVTNPARNMLVESENKAPKGVVKNLLAKQDKCIVDEKCGFYVDCNENRCIKTNLDGTTARYPATMEGLKQMRVETYAGEDMSLCVLDGNGEANEVFCRTKDNRVMGLNPYIPFGNWTEEDIKMYMD